MPTNPAPSRSTGPFFASRAALDRHLDGLGPFHMDLTLSRIASVLAALSPARPKAVVRIVGTNGKGSTAAFLDALLREHGIKTGLYTSPHLMSPRERIKIGGRPVDSRTWLGAANAVAAARPETVKTGDTSALTYFELITAMAAWAFGNARVDAAIYESGLGAKNDATAAIETDLVLFTPIGLDHQAVIGPRLSDIARDKAFAIVPGAFAISAPQPGEAMAELAERAAKSGVDLEIASELPSQFGDTPLGLAGTHQMANAALALAGFTKLAAKLGVAPDPEAIRRALKTAFIPGRLQSLPGHPPALLDAAHNPHGLTALAASLAAMNVRPGALVFACMADKDAAAMAPLAASLSDGPILLPQIPDNARAMSPDALAGLFGKRARSVDSLAAALAALKTLTAPVLVCGSLYLLAEFYKLRPRALVPPRR